MIEVCLTIDKHTVECGYVTVFSLLEHASEKVSIMVCYDRDEGLPAHDWSDRLRACNFDFDLRYQMIDNRPFRGIKAMFDSYACYLRMSAPQYALSDRLMYLDADMVFTGDIAPLYHMDLSGATIGLLKSGNCAVRRDKERELLAKFGKQGDDPYFGATIALIDAARYRDANKLQACIDVAKTYPGFLVLYDQSILNCAFALDEIASVPLTWIQEAPRSGRLPDFRPGMIHICGSPKPWDLLGEWFHPYYKEWRAVATRGGLPGVNWKNYFSAQALRRAWRVRRQYAVWLKP